MKIGKFEIGLNHPPIVVAEISGNHGGSLANAKELIRRAADAGADAVKTQCYEPRTITLDMSKPDFIVQEGLWRGRTLWELYKSAHTPFAWHKELYKEAEKAGILIFSSVFDLTAVDHLETLGCPAYKIASMEIGDTNLIKHASRTGKPLIISTGMASTQEIIDANEASDGKALFLHCMSEYPGTIETSNLWGIHSLMKLLPKNPIGISDHSPGSVIPIAATALGACMIEKHFGGLAGVKSEDDEFSMTSREFSLMVQQVKQTFQAMQPHANGGNPSRQFRRSLYAVEDIQEGEAFTPQNIRSIRPGYGMAPKMYPFMLGKKAKKSYRKGDPL